MKKRNALLVLIGITFALCSCSNMDETSSLSSLKESTNNVSSCVGDDEKRTMNEDSNKEILKTNINFEGCPSLPYFIALETDRKIDLNSEHLIKVYMGHLPIIDGEVNITKDQKTVEEFNEEFEFELRVIYSSSKTIEKIKNIDYLSSSYDARTIDIEDVSHPRSEVIFSKSDEYKLNIAELKEDFGEIVFSLYAVSKNTKDEIEIVTTQINYGKNQEGYFFGLTKNPIAEYNDPGIISSGWYKK